MTKENQKLIDQKNEQNNQEGSQYVQNQLGSQQQNSEHSSQLSQQQASKQQLQESSPVEAAIKSMKFRSKRGAKMQDLMKGKIDKDQFWDKNNIYFGGDLKAKDEDQHQSQYQASSSGRDEFDSDFDLTDSFPGKRGRKKGQKVKRRIARNKQSKPRGRPRKVKLEESQQLNKESQIVKKEQITNKKKRIYKQIPNKPTDVFVIYKAIGYKKKVSKIKKQQCHQKNENKIDSIQNEKELL